MKRSVRFLGPIGLLGVGLLIAAASAARAPDDTSAAQGATVSLLPSSQNVQRGDTFTIDVAAENVTNLAAFEFTISFDPGILSVGSIQESGFLGSTGRNVSCQGPLTEPPYVSAGSVKFGCVTESPSVTALPVGLGVLATVTFVAIGEGVSPLTFGPLQLANGNTGDCCEPITPNEAAVRVVGPDDPTPESLPPTPTRNPRAMTPTPIPGAPTPRSGPVLPGTEYQDPGGTAAGAGDTSASSSGTSSSGGAASGDGTTGSTGASPRAGTGPPAEETPWWPILASALLAVGGATLLSLAAYARRVGMRRRT